MNHEIQQIIRDLDNVLGGEPWYGKPVYQLMEEAQNLDVYKLPGKGGHSLIELLFHMITWSEFALASLKKAKKHEIDSLEALNWRTIDPARHSWQTGMHEFRSVNKSIVAFLEQQEDDFLAQQVEFRKYDMRFLLQGLMTHHIYHTGQIACMKYLLQ